MKKLLVTFMVALFATIVFGQTRDELKPFDLPVCVKDYIHKNFANYTIDKGFRIENKMVVTYEVTLMKAKEQVILNFDDKCKVVKKIIPNVKKAPERKPLPPVKNPATGTEKPAPK